MFPAQWKGKVSVQWDTTAVPKEWLDTLFQYIGSDIEVLQSFNYPILPSAEGDKLYSYSIRDQLFAGYEQSPNDLVKTLLKRIGAPFIDQNFAKYIRSSVIEPNLLNFIKYCQVAFSYTQ
jgi:hypothetical protein